MLNFLFFSLTQTHLQDNFVVLGSRVNIEYSRHRKLQVEQRETRSHLEDRDWVCFKVWSNFCYIVVFYISVHKSNSGFQGAVSGNMTT